MEIEELRGKILTTIDGAVEGSSEIEFTTIDGESFKLYHEQDCCESVYVESIVGDIRDLLNTPIIVAEEVNGFTPADRDEPSDSYTWTFYKLDTIKGGVTIRWLGESNGYYSESVYFDKCD